ncbi:MAG: DUF4159 domain-containing protein [Phycisphaerae bacterium]
MNRANTRTNTLCIALTALTVLGLLSANLQAAEQGKRVSEEKVKQAIAGCTKYIFSLQNKQGHWETFDRPKMPGKFGENELGPQTNWGGRTGLALNALATLGRDQQQDERFLKGVQWLMKQDLEGTYAIGLRMELVARLADSKKYIPVIRKDMSELLSGARKNSSPAWISWSYTAWSDKKYMNSEGKGDYSNTNYAVLGIWAAHEMHQEPPANVWTAIERSWAGGQQPDGGWAYQHKAYPGFTWNNYDQPAGTMTAAGIASLYIVMDSYTAPRGSLGSYRNSIGYRSIQRGLKWMDKNFSAEKCVNRKNVGGYYFYNVERVAKAAGLKYFGTHDWFRETAAKIVASQEKDGSIKFGGGGEKDELVDTSFSLMCLSSGAAPVVMNKLHHAGDWDNYLTDLSILCRWMEKEFEQPVNWQVVNLKAPAAELTDSRILYISGAKDPLTFTDEEKAKLKKYVRMGGLLVFQADIPGALGNRWTESAEKLLSELWPELEMSDVDLTTHPLGNIHYKIQSRRIQIREMAGPLRTHAFVLNNGPANIWRRRMYRTGEDVFQLGACLHLYATNKAGLSELPTKLSYFGDPFRGEMARTDKTVELVQVKHSDNDLLWNPEPLALERFSRELAADAGVKLKLTAAKPKDLAASKAKVAFMTGLLPVKMTSEELNAIDTFVKGGGTLIIGQAGGPDADRKKSFHDSVRSVLEDKYGRRSVRPMPSSHELIRDLGKLRYTNIGGLSSDRKEALLWSVDFENRRAGIILSAYDIVSGLLAVPNPKVSGVAHEDAYRLMKQLVLESAGVAEAGSDAR